MVTVRFPILAAVILASCAPRAALCGEAAAEMRHAFTQYGIPWTFAKPVPAGRFVTGDWWVVGPVTVDRVTPAPTADRHGSVVNPPAGSTQGYDARIAGFDASLRGTFPLKLVPGESLVSTASVDTIGRKTPETARGQYCRGPLRRPRNDKGNVEAPSNERRETSDEF